ncbi:hypothetical protein HAX54_052521 [Datura stramonium]|uniref:Uncharacterized protein n=1 Tax=Datura stramonium TaxID=4076 RepID=A0ABS8SZN2_DATST|nr:hypothetical protein [Datura stramonium]
MEEICNNSLIQVTRRIERAKSVLTAHRRAKEQCRNRVLESSTNLMNLLAIYNGQRIFKLVLRLSPKPGEYDGDDPSNRAGGTGGAPDHHANRASTRNFKVLVSKMPGRGGFASKDFMEPSIDYVAGWGIDMLCICFDDNVWRQR